MSDVTEIITFLFIHQEQENENGTEDHIRYDFSTTPRPTTTLIDRAASLVADNAWSFRGKNAL